MDVEYNRGYQKKDHHIKSLYDKNIILDIAVHKRPYDENTGYDNLVCIEMKKKNGSRSIAGLEDDQERLRALTSDLYGFGYRIGFMILVVMDEKNEEYKLEISNVYVDGEEE